MKDELENNSLLTSIEHIWKYSFSIFQDIFKLFALEIKLAGKSLAVIFILVVIAALLLISSWFSLLGVVISWLLTLHISLILSLLLVSAINLIIAIGIGIYIFRISNNLHFNETRKQLELMRDDNDETITSEN